MLRRRALSSPRLRRARHNAIFRKTLIFGAFVVALAIGARTFLNLDFLTINSVKVVGAEKTSAEEIKSIVVSQLSGKWLGIIPKNNFLFIGKESISNTILGSYPNIANVRSVLAGLGNLVIKIKEKTSYARWCGLSAPIGTCLMIDEGGFAVEKDDSSITASTTPGAKY